MSKELAIVFIHKGNSWYLPYTLWQCKQMNPLATIYLIGDKQTKHFPKWVHHIDIALFDDAGKELTSIYEHHSSLGAGFELMCIERWFILNQFMIDRKINSCVYLDSDILVYSNLQPYAEQFSKQSDMSWCSFSAHSNFISNRKGLERYCANVIDTYNHQFPEEFRAQSLYHQIKEGKLSMNISDMTFFYDYNLRYPNSLLVVSDPILSGTFDISMEETRVFEDDGEGFKKIIWKDKTPYCIEKSSQKKYPFVTLHFQGKGKQILKKNFKFNSLSFSILLFKNNIYILLQKIKNKTI